MSYGSSTRSFSQVSANSPYASSTPTGGSQQPRSSSRGRSVLPYGSVGLGAAAASGTAGYGSSSYASNNTNYGTSASVVGGGGGSGLQAMPPLADRRSSQREGSNAASAAGAGSGPLLYPAAASNRGGGGGSTVGASSSRGGADAPSPSSLQQQRPAADSSALRPAARPQQQQQATPPAATEIIFFDDDDIDVNGILAAGPAVPTTTMAHSNQRQQQQQQPQQQQQQPQPQQQTAAMSASHARARLNAALNASGGSSNSHFSSTGNSSNPPSSREDSASYGYGTSSSGASSLSSTGSSSQAQAGGGCDGTYGLVNLGNTCFLNSTLQCLLRTSEFRRFLIRTDLAGFGRATPVTSALQQLCRKMNGVVSTAGGGGSVPPSARGGGTALNPSGFKQAIGRACSSFVGTDQQDAQEFMRLTLDQVHEEANRIRRKVPYEELKDIDREPPQRTADRWWQNHRDRHDSVVQDAFSGQFFVRTKCAECGTVSVACEPFLDLSIPITRAFGSSANNSEGGAAAGSSGAPTTIHKSLEDFFGESKVDSETPFRCAKCAKFVAATREIKLYRLPDVLVIHLKRFRHYRLRSSKIDDLVEFPFGNEELLVDGYLSDFAPPMPPAACAYTLRGVVNHFGSVNGGHYKAVVRVETSASGSAAGQQQWVEFNDEATSVMSGRSVCSNSAYLLFYERSSGQGRRRDSNGSGAVPVNKL